jgi:uncharacterized membrane protein
MRTVTIVVLVAAAVTTGLSAGLLWGWAVSVMPAVLALLLYLATVGIARLVNIPLNNRMDTATPESGIRQDFETPWTRWNIVRSLTGAASLAALCWTLVVV